jgi:hypothetical protein
MLPQKREGDRNPRTGNKLSHSTKTLPSKSEVNHQSTSSWCYHLLKALPLKQEKNRNPKAGKKLSQSTNIMDEVLIIQGTQNSVRTGGGGRPAMSGWGR